MDNDALTLLRNGITIKNRFNETILINYLIDYFLILHLF